MGAQYRDPARFVRYRVPNMTDQNTFSIRCTILSFRAARGGISLLCVRCVSPPRPVFVVQPGEGAVWQVPGHSSTLPEVGGRPMASPIARFSPLPHPPFLSPYFLLLSLLLCRLFHECTLCGLFSYVRACAAWFTFNHSRLCLFVGRVLSAWSSSVPIGSRSGGSAPILSGKKTSSSPPAPCVSLCFHAHAMLCALRPVCVCVCVPIVLGCLLSGSGSQSQLMGSGSGGKGTGTFLQRQAEAEREVIKLLLATALP